MKLSASFILVMSTIWLTGCTLFSKIDFPDNTCSTDIVDGSRIFLGQCWSTEERRAFYSTSQGSHIAPYDLSTFVELPDSDQPFLSPKNIEKWRYLPSDNSQDNPWPIGFVKDSVPSGRFKGDWIGMNCSACHTAELHYQGKQYRIDGGPTLADKTGFINELDSALEETYLDGLKKPRPDGSPRDGAKFARYAKHFPNESPESLHERLKSTVDARREWHKRNDYKVNGQVTTQGHGRLDAFTLIFNEINHIMGLKGNYHDPSAPVSYPFLWGTHFHDWVQWNGISPASATTRNVAQLFGSFGRVQLKNKQQNLSHESTFQLGNQHQLENLVQTLRAPVWPKAFGEINKQKVGRGEKLFKEHCKSCHDGQIGDRDSWWRPDGNVKMVPVGPNDKGLPPVETDPLMARNAMRKAIGTLSNPLEETNLAEQLNKLTFKEVTGILPTLRFFSEFFSIIFDFDKPGVVKQPLILQGIEAYKARPLDGIWATAPYLHNGSVPNLFELLLPPGRRTTRFCVGEREFDPIKVGFVVTQDCAPEKLLDTTIEGNSNSGHNYGNPKLTDEDRWDLVEYQKALSDPSSERD